MYVRITRNYIVGAFGRSSKLLNEVGHDPGTSKMIRLIEDNSVQETGESNLFRSLVISEPSEFQNKTFNRHLLDLPWREIYKNVEGMFYYGRHKVFCRWNNNSLAMVRLF